MVPMWSRTLRFSNVYAFAALDLLSVIFWLSAWAAVASYVGAGKSKGKKTNASGCDNFSLGSTAKCKLSEATIILGVVVMLLFGATSYFSIKAVMHYRRTGEMPAAKPVVNDFAAQTQDAFSSNLQTDEFDEAGLDPRQGGRSGLGISRHEEDDEYALLHQGESEDLSQSYPAQVAAPLQYSQNNHDMPNYDTSYGGAYGRHSPNPMEEAGYDNPAPVYGR